MVDYFAVLELPRRLQLDLEDLGRRFRTRSFAVHPDFHARAGEAERQNALVQSAQLNEAYRVLKDPLRRTRHLLALEGCDAEQKPSQALLMAVFELQELLDEPSTPVVELESAKREWEEQRATLAETLDTAFVRWDQGDRGALGAFTEILTRQQYIENLLQKLNERLTTLE